MSDEPSYYETIIPDCIALVQSHTAPDLPPNRIGTAFFVTSDLLLTCAHVVQNVAGLSVKPYLTSKSMAATVVRVLEVEAGDLALLRVREPDPDQKAVLLHILGPFAGRRPVMLPGYPYDALAVAGSFRPCYGAAVSDSTDPATLTGISIEAGADVAHGLSGSPVLDLATGTVIGITRYRGGTDSAVGTGGGAIPVARAVKEFPEVREAYDRPPVAAGAWLDKRTLNELRTIGREPSGTTGRLDLRLSGDLNEWFVDVAEEMSGQTPPQGARPDGIVLDALQVDVARAVFQWMRGRGTSTSQDFQLVGEILSAALLRGKAASQYRAWHQAAAELTVRLIAEPGCGLADLPWEYAKPSLAEDRRLGLGNLGLDEKLALSRVMLGSGQGAPRPPAGHTASVLALVVQPKEKFEAVMNRDQRPVAWPGISELHDAMKEMFASPLSMVQDGPIFNPTLNKLDELQKLHTLCDVLHYQGFVRITPEQTQVCITDETSRNLAVTGISVDVLAELARRVQAKVVVLEAHSGRDSVYTGDDPALSMAKPFLDRGVMAVLTTRIPVHPVQAGLFNRHFYQSLAAGMTVERAAQRGRIRFNLGDPLPAQGTYGAFVLWTVDMPGLRLVIPPPAKGQPAGSRPEGIAQAGLAAAGPSPAPEDSVVRVGAATGGDQ